MISMEKKDSETEELKLMVLEIFSISLAWEVANALAASKSNKSNLLDKLLKLP